MRHASHRMFALLLALYPREFRKTYAASMHGDFDDEMASRTSAIDRTRYMLGAFVDIAAGAIDERTIDLRRDLAMAMRTIRKAPGFALVIIGTLGLAIGANAAVFSIVRPVVLAPLPFPDAGRIVVLDGLKDGAPFAFSLPDFADLHLSTQTLASAAAMVSYDYARAVQIDGQPHPLSVALVTPPYFDVFGVPPELGRYENEADARPGAAPTIVLSDRAWRTLLGADPSAVGKTLRLDDQTARVIGVASPQLQPSDVSSTDYDAWMPLFEFENSKRNSRDSHYFDAVARLKAGVSADAAQRELETIFASLRKRYPADLHYGVGVRPLLDDVVGDVRPTLFAIFAAVTAVLVISCANVANLLLGRASVREREIAVRLALGAPRERILQQLLTETFVLVALGGMLGIAIAFAALTALVSSHTDVIPRLSEVGIDAWTLGYTAALTMAVTVIAGLAPALSLTRRRLAPALAAAGRSGDMNRGGRSRTALAVFQIACALSLVVVAGLVTRSYANLISRPLGFDASHVSAVQGVQLWGKRYATDSGRIDYFDQVRSRVRAIPGVVTADWAFSAPFVFYQWTQGFTIAGNPVIATGGPTSEIDPVGPDYFSLLHIPLRLGRSFTDSDRAGARPVIVVNETFVRQFLPNRNPLGIGISFGSIDQRAKDRSTPVIVGVVGDTRPSFAARTQPTIYRPFAQSPGYVSTLLVRSTGDVDVGNAVARAFSQSDPHLLPVHLDPLAKLMDRSAARARFTMNVIGALSIVAIGLALVGIFAVVSYGVAQRTREFGIRMALGARPITIRADVIARAMRIALCGIAVGIMLSAVVVRSFTLALYDVAPLDPVTFTVVAVLVAAASLAAAFVPAWRATRVDPAIALRVE